MEISQINFLMPLEVVFLEDGQNKSMLVFYESESSRIVFLNDVSEETKSAIITSVKEQFNDAVDNIEFSIPDHLTESIYRIDNDRSYFGLTPDIENPLEAVKDTNPENKKEQ